MEEIRNDWSFMNSGDPYEEEEPRGDARTTRMFRETLRGAAKAAPAAAIVGMDWGTGAAPLRLGVHKAVGTPMDENAPWYEVPGYEEALAASGMGEGKLRSGLGMGLDILGDPGFALGAAGKMGARAGRRILTKARKAPAAAGKTSIFSRVAKPTITPSDVEALPPGTQLPLQIKGPEGVGGVPMREPITPDALPGMRPGATTPQLPFPSASNPVDERLADISSRTSSVSPDEVLDVRWDNMEGAKKVASKADKLLGIPSRGVEALSRRFYKVTFPKFVQRGFRYGNEEDVPKVFLKYGIGVNPMKSGHPKMMNHLQEVKTGLGEELAMMREYGDKEAAKFFDSLPPNGQQNLSRTHYERADNALSSIVTPQVRRMVQGLTDKNQVYVADKLMGVVNDTQKILTSKGYLSPGDVQIIRSRFKDALTFEKDAPKQVTDVILSQAYGVLRKLEDDVMRDFTSPEVVRTYRDLSHDYSVIASSFSGKRGAEAYSEFQRAAPRNLLGPKGALGEKAASTLGILGSLGGVIAGSTGNLPIGLAAGLSGASLYGLSKAAGSIPVRRIGGGYLNKVATNPWGGAFIDSLARDRLIEMSGGRKKPMRKEEEDAEQ